MIKAILVFNNHGVPRLVKFYQRFERQKDMITHLFIQISKRSDSLCNFLLADPKYWGSSGNKIMYRHYATLYFVFVCDEGESELGILDLIQVFVETLDKCFENVCELDLIFHPDKCHYILDEICMGGMVLETNVGEILSAIDGMNKLEKKDNQASNSPHAKGSKGKGFQLPGRPAIA